jgi:glycosyltransferase involved in cell wall biosynthesis
MQIAFIITDLEPGGAEKCLAELLLRLDRNQYSPIVYVLQSRPALDRSSLVARLEAARIPLIFLNARNIWATPRVVWQLWCSLRKTRPQVVQTFLFHANLLGILASRGANISNLFVGVRVAEPNRWLRYRWRRWLENLFYPWARGVVFVSHGVQASYAGSRFQKKSLVIQNGIDAELYCDVQPADLTAIGLSANTPMLLFAGRLHPQKGLSEFLEHLPRLLTLHPHHLCIAGEGPEKRRLQLQVEKMGLNQRVHFLGWREDIPALLKRADMLLLPSRYEGMPNIVLEAMAAETPLIATQVEGVAELLAEETIHCTAKPGDMKSLIDAVDWMLEHPEKRREIAQKLHQRAIDVFDYVRMTGDYVRIWGTTIERTMQ